MKERILFGIITMLACFVFIGLDAAGIIDIGKFGYAGIGSWLTLIIQFYYRKAKSAQAG